SSPTSGRKAVSGPPDERIGTPCSRTHRDANPNSRIPTDDLIWYHPSLPRAGAGHRGGSATEGSMSGGDAVARRYRPGSDVLFQELDGEAVLLHLASGVYYSLDPVGTRIWNLAVAGNSPEEVSAQLLRDYEVSAEQAARDVAALLAELQRHDLLHGHDC